MHTHTHCQPFNEFTTPELPQRNTIQLKLCSLFSFYLSLSVIIIRFLLRIHRLSSIDLLKSISSSLCFYVFLIRMTECLKAETWHMCMMEFNGWHITHYVPEWILLLFTHLSHKYFSWLFYSIRTNSAITLSPIAASQQNMFMFNQSKIFEMNHINLTNEFYGF